jgi:hypothetical protein
LPKRQGEIPSQEVCPSPTVCEDDGAGFLGLRLVLLFRKEELITNGSQL